MRRNDDRSRIIRPALAAAFAVCLLVQAASAMAADVGMVTQVTGKAVYGDSLNPDGAKPVQAFMKIRGGDRIKLPEGAGVKLVYFAGGAQETWTGPVTVLIGTEGGKPEGATGVPRVEVTKLPVQVAEVMQSAPMAATRDNISKGGFINVRAPKPVVLALDEEGLAKLTQARETYASLRQTAGPDDAYPEWYLVAVLTKYGQYEEMTALVDARLKERPKNQGYKQLKKHVADLTAAAAKAQ